MITYIHATCCIFLSGVNKAILKTRICAYRCNVQQKDDDQSVEPTESETYKFFNPERHVNQRQIDILPGLLPNDIYSSSLMLAIHVVATCNRISSVVVIT